MLVDNAGLHHRVDLGHGPFSARKTSSRLQAVGRTGVTDANARIHERKLSTFCLSSRGATGPHRSVSASLALSMTKAAAKVRRIQVITCWLLMTLSRTMPPRRGRTRRRYRKVGEHEHSPDNSRACA